MLRTPLCCGADETISLSGSRGTVVFPYRQPMKLIRSILDRLSDSFFVSVSEKVRLAIDPAGAPSLRLVSDKSSATVDPITRRTPNQAGSQLDAIDDAVRRSQAWFLGRQHATEGYWVAELEADTTLTSEYLMLRRLLDRVDPERERKAVRYLRSAQLPDGGWPIYYGGPSEISASVKAYFALKLSGVSGDEPFMLRARLYPREGRRGANQRVHQNHPGLVRPV